MLIVDEADTRKLVSTVLAECGAEVTVVGSVDEAIDAIAQLKPDVLVGDIGMPGKDGYVFIGKVKEIEAEIRAKISAIALFQSLLGIYTPAPLTFHTNFRIGLLTADARAEDHQKALLAGFQLHMAKPVKSDELIASVARLAVRARKL